MLPDTIISPHRAARFSGWLRLWLVWFVGVCARWFASGGVAPSCASARDLDRVARAVCDVVFLHVCARMREPQPTGRHRHGRKQHATWRATFGARLRHATRGRDFAARLFALLALMRDLERHVTALARRLKRGLTRLRVLFPERADESCALSPVVCVAGADTS